MEQNQTTMEEAPEQDQENDSAQKKDAELRDNKVKSNTDRNLRAGIILCAILAVIGVVSGVGAISHSARERSYYEKRIRDLKDDNDRLRSKYSTFYNTGIDNEKEDNASEENKNDGRTTDEDTSYFIEGGSNGCDGSINADINPQGSSNRIIAPNNDEEVYAVHFMSSNVDSGYGLQIGLMYGDINYCRILKKKNDANGQGYIAQDVNECNIKGLDGKVLKIVEFYSGQDSANANIGFIMVDGRVRFLPLFSSVKNNDYQICGNVGINGVVTDAIQISVGSAKNHSGGSNSTVFVLDDGSQIKYDESMVK